MKKVLFATTALIATGGMAAADVTLSGSGRFGIVYNNQKVNGVAAAFAKTKIEKRMTINIDGSGSTDGGLEFGGRIRLRSDEAEAASAQSSANVWMGNDMFRVTVGNTQGAAVNRLNYFAGSVGLTGLHWGNVSFNIGSRRFLLNTYSSRGDAGNVVRLDFNVGGLGVSLSTDTSATTAANGGVGGFAPNVKVAGTETSIAANYNFGDWTVAAGYTMNANNAPLAANESDMVSLSVNGSIGDFGVGLAYSDLDTNGTSAGGNKVVLSGSYNFGDTTVTGFVARVKADTAATIGFAAGSSSETEYGLGFTHSLGGATLAGGISRNYQKNTMADLGVRFNF